MTSLFAIDGDHGVPVGFGTEVCGCLVVPAVFKTDVAEHLGQAGSIPVHLRQNAKRQRFPWALSVQNNSR